MCKHLVSCISFLWAYPKNEKKAIRIRGERD